MPTGDHITGREFSDFQRLYIENHKAVADAIATSQRVMEARLDAVNETLRSMNGIVRSNGERTTRLEAQVATLVQDIEDIGTQGCALRREHEEALTKIREPPVTPEGLSRAQKAGLGAGAVTLTGLVVWEIIRRWNDVVAAVMKVK